MASENSPTSEAALSTDTNDDYEWATGCSECQDGPRIHDDEIAARRQYEENVVAERTVPVDDRHTMVLLRRSRRWETVTTSAWDGRRDAS